MKTHGHLPDQTVVTVNLLSFLTLVVDLLRYPSLCLVGASGAVPTTLQPGLIWHSCNSMIKTHPQRWKKTLILTPNLCQKQVSPTLSTLYLAASPTLWWPDTRTSGTQAHLSRWADLNDRVCAWRMKGGGVIWLDCTLVQSNSVNRGSKC